MMTNVTPEQDGGVPSSRGRLSERSVRVFAMASLAIVTAFSVTACETAEVEAETSVVEFSSDRPEKPNIIYILADDLGYGDISPFGQTRFETPNLDRMAREGMVFTQHYSGATVCAPSRSALLTGQHGGNTPIRSNGGGLVPGTYLEADTQTVITLLNEAGYTTSVFGKWGMGNYDNAGGPDTQEVDYFYGYVEHVPAHNYYPPFLTENGERQMLDNNGVDVHNHSPETKAADPESIYRNYIGNEYSPDLMQAKAQSFIQREKGKPFFMYYASIIPHAALQIPDEELERFDFPEVGVKADYYSPHPRPRAARAAMIQHLDEEIGLLLDTLEREGLAENTLVIFTSDNGPAPEGGGDMEFFQASGPFRGHKRDLTEGGIRVPMIAWWPGQIAAGESSDHVTAMWDFLPTAAEVANVEVRDQINGLSIVPTLKGEGEQAQHDYLYWEFHGGRKNLPAQAVRKGDWKAIREYYRKNGNKAKSGSEALPTQLYDLSTDPAELNNLAEQYPDIVREMEAYMDRRTPTVYRGWNFE